LTGSTKAGVASLRVIHTEAKVPALMQISIDPPSTASRRMPVASQLSTPAAVVRLLLTLSIFSSKPVQV
jgi:hypothetical protein